MKTHDRNNYEDADLMFEDGDWALMNGPVTWMMDQNRYFLHHTCTVKDEEGNHKWQSWYYPEEKGSLEWCEYCDSEPPKALLGLRMMMVHL